MGLSDRIYPVILWPRRITAKSKVVDMQFLARNDAKVKAGAKSSENMKNVIKWMKEESILII